MYAKEKVKRIQMTMKKKSQTPSKATLVRLIDLLCPSVTAVEEVSVSEGEKENDLLLSEKERISYFTDVVNLTTS